MFFTFLYLFWWYFYLFFCCRKLSERFRGRLVRCIGHFLQIQRSVPGCSKAFAMQSFDSVGRRICPAVPPGDRSLAMSIRVEACNQVHYLPQSLERNNVPERTSSFILFSYVGDFSSSLRFYL